MTKTIRDLLVLVLSCFLITAAIWTPHYLKINIYNLNFANGFNTIYQNYDGLEYVVIAKSFYDPSKLAAVPQDKKANYFPSHFPGYALLISVFAPVMGYLKSMLFVTQISTILSSIVFYFLIKNFKLSQHPLTLSLIFLILPARFLIVHSVGSSEPTFILFTLLAFYSFLKFEASQKIQFILLTGVFGSLALLTRPPGLLLIIALAFFIKIKLLKELRSSGLLSVIKLKLRYLPLLLIPLTLVGIFYLFQIQLDDFWAYFHSGDNIHLTFPPFQVFDKNAFWVGDIWLEDIIYIYLLGFLGGLILLKKELTRPLGFYVLTFMIAGISISHRDISRYLLPISPFVLIAYERVLTSKEFRIALIIIALGIYLYSQNFILNNTAPIDNVSLFN